MTNNLKNDQQLFIIHKIIKNQQLHQSPPMFHHFYKSSIQSLHNALQNKSANLLWRAFEIRL